VGLEGCIGYTTSNEALLRANKFHAVLARCAENEGKFPYILEETCGEGAHLRICLGR
jgi:hypothetical protein